jgi:hypothetical protein
MNRNKLIEELKNLKVGYNKVNPTVIVNEEGILVSAEEGDGAADYYGVDGVSEYPYIDPALESFAKRHDMYWEWRDAGTLVLAE